MATVVYCVQDLLFSSKIREVCQRLGARAVAARPPDLIDKAKQAALVVLDLRLPSAIALLDELRTNGVTASVVGFVDHEREEIFAAAGALRCRALPKGKFSSELPKIIASLS